MLFIIMAGLISAFTIRKETQPEFELNWVQVEVPYLGAAPQEVEEGVDVSKYLWGSAAYAFAGVLMRSFAQTGWFVDTRGVQAGIDGGGLVAGTMILIGGDPGIGKSTLLLQVAAASAASRGEVVYVTGDVSGSQESPVYAILAMNKELKKINRADYGGTEGPITIYNAAMPFTDLGL